MSILSNMPHTCTAKRRTRTSDAYGGTKDTYSVLFADRACWRQPASNTDIVEFQKRDITVTHKVYFVADPTLDERDILAFGDDDLEVKSYADPDASVGMGVVYRVMTELKETG